MPALVAGCTLGARRWGPRIGGWLTALPVVAGPTLLFLAMEQDAAFAARAALGTLVAMIAVAAFGVVYAWVSVRCGWALSVLAGWAAFVAATVLLLAVPWTPITALVAALAGFSVAARVLPAARPHPSPSSTPAWDLPLRMIGTLAVVLTVTSAADRLGPALSGAFTPFPVALTVLVVFAHAQQGAPVAVQLLRGFFPAMWGFALFCLVLAQALVPLGPALAFALAIAAQLAVHGLVFWRIVRIG